MSLSCPFAEVGCTAQHTDTEALRCHMGQDTVRHSLLLCQGVLDMYKEARALKTLQRSYDQLDIRLTNLEHQPGAHLVWKIEDFKDKLRDAKMGIRTVIHSPPFLTARHGYKLILMACLNGDGKAKGKFVSVFVSICRGEYDGTLLWPFSHQIKLTLLNQADDPSQRRHVTFLIKPNLVKENRPFLTRPQSQRNPAFGPQNFVELSMLEKMAFVKEDCVFIGVDVDMSNM